MPSWDRVKAAFQRVLDHPPETWPSVLPGICEGDVHLQAEVESLLAAHRQDGTFCERPALQWARADRSVLRAGSRLGPYEILEHIASGGMGEVYRAVDTRLGRSVALKIIGGALEQHPAIQRRFDEEAKFAARLDHPRICAVYDVGEHDAIRYFVMEFLEGESLAERLARGRLPTAEVLGYGIEIASALAYAHRQGVLHRDIKPGNVFITPSGVKVLDFGLAKLRRQFEARSDADGPATGPMTQPHVVHGTAAYIAPERLQGHAADHRSDIFAFGALLYEMATGRRAFDGASPAQVMAAVISDDPPRIAARGTATTGLDWIIRRCLKKDPEARWQSMSDVELVLKWLASGAEGGMELSGAATHEAAARVVERSERRAGRVAYGVAAMIACGALALWGAAWMSRSVPSTEPLVRLPLPVEPVPTIAFGAGLDSRLALSRDGHRLAYVSNRGTTTAVYVRDMAGDSTVPVAGTDGATSVLFSPDGQEIAFFAAGKLKKVGVASSAVTSICDAPEGAGATWGEDDTIIFAPSPMSPLMRVSARGGAATPATTLREGETSHRWPDLLPGGKAIVYAAARGTDFTSARIVVESLENGRRTDLAAGTYPRYVPTGHLVFAKDATLYAMRFDSGRLRTTGNPEPIVRDVRTNSTTGAALFAISERTLVYRANGPTTDRAFVWVDANGREEPMPLDAGRYLQPRLSRDGTRIAFSVGEREDRDVWTYDLVHHRLAPLTSEPGEDETPVWSPESGRIALTAQRRGQQRTILMMPADRSGPATLLWSGPFPIHVGDWSPDGWLAWTEFNPNAGGRIRALSVASPGTVRTIAAGTFDARGPAFSPDGRWIAYTSNESGRDEIYVQPFPGPGYTWHVSKAGGQQPLWSRDGRHLYYRGEAHVMIVDVRTTPTFSHYTARPLFKDDYETEHRADRNYDLSPDGRRFLMLKPARPYPPAELTVVQNWKGALRGGG